MKWIFGFVVTILLCGVSVPQSSYAQFTTLSQEFSISLEPLMPLPGEPVKVFISSSSYDLNSFEIVWMIDDKQIAADLGITSVNVTAPFNRSLSHKVSALIKTDSRTIEKTLYVQGRSVAILEQAANTAAFPGYRGRRIPSTEEDLKIVAIPDESFSEYVTYTWDKNYIEGLPDLSGSKRNYFIIPGTIFTDIETVGLTLDDLQTRRKMRSYLDISFNPPSIELYGFTNQNNPDFYHAIGNAYELQKNKVITSILAYPFGYNKSFLKNPELTWSIGGEEITPYTNKLVIPLKNEGSDTTGTAEIIVTTSPSQSLSQETTKSVSVSY